MFETWRLPALTRSLREMCGLQTVAFCQPPVPIDTTSWTIDYKTLGVSIKLLVPDLPSDLMERSGPPFTKHSVRHLEWRKKALPWVPHDTHAQYAAKELAAMQAGFPLVDDETSALALAATLVSVCEVDDIIERMDFQTTELCVRACVPILGGEHSNNATEVLSFESDLEKAKTVCQEYQLLITSLFSHRWASLILQDMQDMVLGQLPEKHLVLGSKSVKDLPSYIGIRIRPFGLLPLLRVAESFCLNESDSARRLPETSLLMDQVRSMAVLQNDAGGLEKDLKTGNTSNSLFVLAKLAGRSIEDKEELQASADIVHRFEMEHDAMVADVINTWAKIQAHSVLGGEVLMSNVLLALCVTHLRWSLSTMRYNAAEIGKLSGGDT